MNSLDYLVFGVSHNPQTAYKDFENGAMTDEHDDTSGADLPPTGVRKTLSENLSALREAMPQGGVRAWAKRLGIGEATISRALAGKENVRIDSLEAAHTHHHLHPLRQSGAVHDVLTWREQRNANPQVISTCEVCGAQIPPKPGMARKTCSTPCHKIRASRRAKAREWYRSLSPEDRRRIYGKRHSQSE